jgi:threonine/homoserine/homoserine lactone efflux protein
MQKPTILIVTALASLVVVTVVAVALGADRMVSPEFLATSLVVVLIPGTGVVYTVSSAIAGGRNRGFIAAVGCTLGIVPHMVAAMLGLSGVMQAGAAAFEVVRWVGVVYLAYMGISMIRNGGALQLDDEDSHEPADTSLTIIRRGVLLNLLNPKLTVFFFAFLPQFLDTAPRLLDPRLVMLGAIFMAITLVVFVGYAYTSAAVRDQVLQSPRVMQWVQRSLGALLIGFAARLAVADR